MAKLPFLPAKVCLTEEDNAKQLLVLVQDAQFESIRVGFVNLMSASKPGHRFKVLVKFYPNAMTNPLLTYLTANSREQVETYLTVLKQYECKPAKAAWVVEGDNDTFWVDEISELNGLANHIAGVVAKRWKSK